MTRERDQRDSDATRSHCELIHGTVTHRMHKISCTHANTTHGRDVDQDDRLGPARARAAGPFLSFMLSVYTTAVFLSAAGGARRDAARARCATEQLGEHLGVRGRCGWRVCLCVATRAREAPSARASRDRVTETGRRSVSRAWRGGFFLVELYTRSFSVCMGVIRYMGTN